MGWNGSGTHNRVHNFSADASAGIQAQAVRFDAEFNDISTALENCQTLTGETTPTANSPMGGFKHTGVAAATSTDNYLRSDQTSQQVGIFVRDANAGLSGKMTASASPFPTAFTEGQRVTVRVSANGSAAAPRAIVINGLSANILSNRGSTVLAKEMLKDGYFDLIYDASASAFRTITPRNDAQGIAQTSTGTFSATWQGFTSAQSNVIEFTKTGNLVTLSFVTAINVTSSTNGLLTSTSALPAFLIPDGGAKCLHPVRDNGTMAIGNLEVVTDGTIRMAKDIADPQGVFTTSGLKGFPAGYHVTYSLDL